VREGTREKNQLSAYSGGKQSRAYEQKASESEEGRGGILTKSVKRPMGPGGGKGESEGKPLKEKLEEGEENRDKAAIPRTEFNFFTKKKERHDLRSGPHFCEGEDSKKGKKIVRKKGLAGATKEKRSP